MVQPNVPRISYEDIKNSMVDGDTHMFLNCHEFLPWTNVKLLAEEHRVRSTLKSWFVPEQDIQHLLEFFTNKAQIVFLILVFTEPEQNCIQHCVQSLYDARLEDKDLPIFKSQAAMTSPWFYTRHRKQCDFFKSWEMKPRDDFFRDQWSFLAPKFDRERFSYEFYESQYLPFIARKEDYKSTGGHFAEVASVGLHVDHLDPQSDRKQLKENKECFQVAVKRLKNKALPDGRSNDIEKFFEKELRTLEIMRDLDNDHLIKPIAAYKKGEYKCFVFPWAQGGNLQAFWNENKSLLDKELVHWALRQMTGMAYAIKLLHENNTRHGDIKPANILRFQMTDDKNNLGTLVIADVGISKIHENYTRYRTHPTTSTHGTMSYDPPEMDDYANGVPVPRIYDIWALGCVFLEFVVWLVLGRSGWISFLRDITDQGGECKFWENTSGVSKPHEKIQKWVEDIKRIVDENSAVWRVVELISKRLLVPMWLSTDDCSKKLKDIQIKSIHLWNYIQVHQVPPSGIQAESDSIMKTSKKLSGCKLKKVIFASRRRGEKPDKRYAELLTAASNLQRSRKENIEALSEKLLEIQTLSARLLNSRKNRADAEAVHGELQEISNCSPKYIFGSKLANQAKARPMGATSNLPASPDQHTSLLKDQWRSTTNKSWAFALISHLDWPTLRPALSDHTTGICDSCIDTEFLSPVLDLGRSLENLSRSSYTCRILKLFMNRAGSAFRTSADGNPVISIYGDPAYGSVLPYAQLGLPILPDFGSIQQFELLKQWIYLCDRTHNCFPNKIENKLIGSMPTRLVYVGRDVNSNIHLIDTEKHATHRYVALSHCWGVLSEQERFCLYKNNKKQLERDILFDSLPKTFRDAVTVTRNLGIFYLWIDSLCIIQDDEQDWEAESARMGTVFSSAYCTIAASSATSSLQGFLGTRTQRAATTIKTLQGPVHLAEPIDDFHEHVEDSALNKRGWVFQERALSRRTIHFTSTQVYWECGGGIQCETQAKLRNSQSEFIGDPNFPAYALNHHKDDRIRLIQYLYRVYSGLCLTKATDRSKAILGLQERLANAFESSAKYGVLSAYFERMLLWEAEIQGGMTRIAYGRTQTVPSWSWMAYVGKIRYMEIPFKEVNWMGNFIDPIGSQSDKADWNGWLLAYANQLLIDEGELSKRSKIDQSNCKIDPIGWRCIVCGESKLSDDQGRFLQYVLLIHQTHSTEVLATYERVGLAVLLDTHIVPGTTKVWVV